MKKSTKISKNQDNVTIDSRHKPLDKLSQFVKKSNSTFTTNLNKKVKNVSVIKIRKTTKSITDAKNPSKMCLNSILLSDINVSKFIMLENRMCYDIELLVTHVVTLFKNGKNYNIDPETNLDSIWNSQVDIVKIENHALVKNPSKLAETEYLYGKDNFVENVKLFKTLIRAYDVNKKYFDLFDKYPAFLLNLNRLGTIFHNEQPTSYFDLDKITSNDIKSISDDKLNKLMDVLINEVINKHSDVFSRDEVKDVNSFKTLIYDVIMINEYEQFHSILEDLSIVLSNTDLHNLIDNIAKLLAIQLNFKESSHAKLKFMEYINKLPEEHQKTANELINTIFETNDCIHRQGNRIRYIFVEWWFKYLKYYGIDTDTIAHDYIPVTYNDATPQLDKNKNDNDLFFINSKILDEFKENENGYHLVMCPSKKVPCWYYKMGKINRWDGINLNNYMFCCRLNASPY